mmetsp:Transcript_108810/g.192707  ORF Transcript_108810/g.192707 Transcript_108810/m.192707 type:complete len:202 (+) Transcript_108810:856-1461(+)
MGPHLHTKHASGRFADAGNNTSFLGGGWRFLWRILLWVPFFLFGLATWLDYTALSIPVIACHEHNCMERIPCFGHEWEHGCPAHALQRSLPPTCSSWHGAAWCPFHAGPSRRNDCCSQRCCWHGQRPAGGRWTSWMCGSWSAGCICHFPRRHDEDGCGNGPSLWLGLCLSCHCIGFHSDCGDAFATPSFRRATPGQGHACR